MQYFYGFFTGRQPQIKTYLYISWVLWAYLVHCEQENNVDDNDNLNLDLTLTCEPGGEVCGA